jgi:hypothetical protein
MEITALTAGSFSGGVWDVRATPMMATARTTTDTSRIDPIASDTADSGCVEYFKCSMVTVCPSPVEQICYLEYYYIFYPGYRVDLQAGEPNRNQKKPEIIPRVEF